MAREHTQQPLIPAGGYQEEPPPELLRGIEQFNHREYFECHETLEGIWIKEPRPIRTFYKGVLQVGVGCYHLLRGNYRGAVIKLDSGARYLEPFTPRCMGVDVKRLITDAWTLHATITQLGPEHFREVDLSLLPLIYYDYRGS
jgi:predicted metal-dependent hydrolase